MWAAYLMNSLHCKSLHRRRTGRPRTGRYCRSCWDTSGCRSRHRWSVGNTRTFLPRSAPCRCSRPDTSPGCSRPPWSPGDTHTCRPHTDRCHCTRQGRRTRSSRGLPSPGCTRSCRFLAGRHHGHCSSCPGLERERFLWFYALFLSDFMQIHTQMWYTLNCSCCVAPSSHLVSRLHRSIPENTGSLNSSLLPPAHWFCTWETWGFLTHHSHTVASAAWCCAWRWCHSLRVERFPPADLQHVQIKHVNFSLLPK